MEDFPGGSYEKKDGFNQENKINIKKNI